MISSQVSGSILIVEDDRKTASLVALYLEREGFRTIIAYEGQEALDLAERHKPILVILDLMLPILDGWEVCRHIRRSSDVPILMLTARGEEVDRISGLTLGADDYVVKPFSPRELVERVKAILRRGRVEPTGDKNLLRHGDLVLDRERRRVSLSGHPLSLTPHEYKLLQALMASPGKVFTRDELVDHIYPQGEAVVIDRVVDVHIGKLRQKIEKDPSHPRYILTERGVGYQFSIAETDLPFIFERFYRGEKSRSREHGGAGIGLAIVKELVEAHGGKVGAAVSSGEVRIWFTLPASNAVSMP